MHTAQSLGWKTPQTTVKKKKGAKKPARKAHPFMKGGTTFINVAQFEELATYVAEVGATVPEAILRKLKAAIRLRREVGRMYASSAADPTTNSTHTHFVSVLERVVALLSPYAETEASGSMEDEDDSQIVADDEPDVAAFQVLSLRTAESIRESFLEDTVLGKTKQTKETPVELLEEEPTAGLFFAAFCFFNDLGIIKAHLMALWLEYKNGTTDLITASTITDVAIEMVRKLETELFKILPQVDSFEQLVDMMLDASCIANGLDLDRSLRDASIVRIETAAVVTWLYADMFWILDEMYAVRMAGIQPVELHMVCEDGKVKRKDSIESSIKKRQSSSLQEKRRYETRILADIYDRVEVYSSSAAIPGPDELSKEMVLLHQTGKITAAVAFGSQLLLDVQSTLQDRLSHPFRELHRQGKELLSITEKVSKESSSYDNWTPDMTQNDRTLAIFSS